MKKISLLAIFTILMISSCAKKSKIVGAWKLDVESSQLGLSQRRCPDNIGNTYFVFESNGKFKFDMINEDHCDQINFTGNYEYDENESELITYVKTIEKRGETKNLEGSSSEASTFKIKLITDKTLVIEIGTESWNLKKQ